MWILVSQKDYNKETNSTVAKEEGKTEKLAVENDPFSFFNILN